MRSAPQPGPNQVVRPRADRNRDAIKNRINPPAKPDKLRTAHLSDLKTPTLICQGTRDPLGSEEEVKGYDLSDAIELLWLPDGDHDLKPRKTVSGYSADDHLKTVAAHVKSWSARL